MSISIEVNSKQLDEKRGIQVHYLPAKINGNGQANVDKFFNNYTDRENGYLTNALRGYPLVGEELSVPDGYTGVVVQEPREPCHDGENRVLKISGTFQRFNYWNYDKIPSKNDCYRQSMQLLEISKELSATVSEAEVLEEMSNNK